MPHIKAGQQLFDRWHSLSLRVAALASIIQNDISASHEAIACWTTAWKDDLHVVEGILSKLAKETLEYLNGPNGEGFIP